MDDLDRASEQEEMMRNSALEAVRNKPPVLQPNGTCYNCAELLVDIDTAIGCFCNCYCRDDWQLRNNTKR